MKSRLRRFWKKFWRVWTTSTITDTFIGISRWEQAKKTGWILFRSRTGSSPNPVPDLVEPFRENTRLLKPEISKKILFLDLFWLCWRILNHRHFVAIIQISWRGHLEKQFIVTAPKLLQPLDLDRNRLTRCKSAEQKGTVFQIRTLKKPRLT